MDNATNVTYTTGYDDSIYLNIFAYIELVMGIIGTIGNTLVIIVVLSTPNMQTLTNYFILNLAAADLLTSILLIGNRFPLDVGGLSIPEGLAADVYCRVYSSAQFFWFTINVSSCNLVLVTMERYFAIVHPLTYGKYFTKRTAAAMISVTWVFVFVLQFFNLAFHGYDPDFGCFLAVYPSPAIGTGIGVMYFVITFLIPMLYMAIAYYKISVCLHQSANSIMAGNLADDRAKTLLVARKRVIRMLFLVILAFGICWTPDSLLFLSYNLGNHIDLSLTYVQCIVVLKFVNSILNPFIYVFKYKQFRQSLAKKFCMCVPCIRNKIADESVVVNTLNTTNS
ncbi:allatostatin-A receptor-like [Ptychodera flava]|uniref:allatostatin-A receptor-like n=1 Tax=Ptychodera flava TaxID=63121 RepID=UPI00396A613C